MDRGTQLHEKTNYSDLVFFNSSGKGVIHVGNNKSVHASSKGVRVDSMSNSYWRTKFVGGKRI
ncbi:MAG: C40 family peptidase [Bacillus sp. (in: firmicutes)]